MDGHRPLTLADDPVASIFLLLVFLFSLSLWPFFLFSASDPTRETFGRRRLSLVVVFLEERRRRQS